MRYVIFLLLFTSCTRSTTIEERKCDPTVDRPFEKVATYYAAQGFYLEAIDEGEQDYCKACYCRTGRVFVFSE
jgi:hypothetical protein